MDILGSHFITNYFYNNFNLGQWNFFVGSIIFTLFLNLMIKYTGNMFQWIKSTQITACNTQWSPLWTCYLLAIILHFTKCFEPIDVCGNVVLILFYLRRILNITGMGNTMLAIYSSSLYNLRKKIHIRNFLNCI